MIRIWLKNEIGMLWDFVLIRILLKDECKYVVLLKFVNMFYWSLIFVKLSKIYFCVREIDDILI